MTGIYVADRMVLNRAALRYTAVLCCLLVLFCAATMLVGVAQRSAVWVRAGANRRDVSAGDHLQALEEQVERFALAGDEQSHMLVDRDANATTVEPLTLPTPADTYGITSRYLVDQTIALYLDKNIIGSSE